MKRISVCLVIFLFISVFFYSPWLDACTTFSLKDGKKLVFGRNYDWVTGVGYVMVNKRNVVKKASNFFDPSSKSAEWISKYGSITFNQYGKEYPMGGMNEAGLVVEVMWLTGTKFPSPDDRPSLGELPWVQYQLDNFDSVEDIIISDSSIRIVENSQPIHYLVCDKTGRTATIEFLNGKMVYHFADTLPVNALANNTYDESLDYMKKHVGFGGDKNISTSSDSLDRFVRAADMLKSYEKGKNKKIVDYAFAILASVKQEGSTQWSIVYDIKNMTVHFKTMDAPQLKKFAFKGFDFSCPTPSKVINMNADKTGDISSHFITYTTAINRKLVGESFGATEFLQGTPAEALDLFAKYPESLVCKKK
jgi:choloylglycine hydrolase